jgi:hypothetical protein
MIVLWNLQIVLRNEYMHVFFWFQKSWLIEHFFPLSGAKEEHCIEESKTLEFLRDLITEYEIPEWETRGFILV